MEMTLTEKEQIVPNNTALKRTLKLSGLKAHRLSYDFVGCLGNSVVLTWPYSYGYI